MLMETCGTVAPSSRQRGERSEHTLRESSEKKHGGLENSSPKGLREVKGEKGENEKNIQRKVKRWREQGCLVETRDG